MNRKTTITILAVALTTAACGSTSETSSSKQPVAGEKSNGEGTEGSKTGDPQQPATTPAPTSTSQPTSACDRTSLSQELGNMVLDEALKQSKKFRCLCDDKGFPLVGNINAKGTTTSQFCGAIREKGLL